MKNDLKKLHDIISPELLPTEFGGTRNDYDDDRIEASLISKRGYFEKIEKYGYVA